MGLSEPSGRTGDLADAQRDRRDRPYRGAGAIGSADIGGNIKRAIMRHAEREAKHIAIEVRDGTVRLSGKVGSFSERKAVRGRHGRRAACAVVDTRVTPASGDRMRNPRGRESQMTLSGEVHDADWSVAVETIATGTGGYRCRIHVTLVSPDGACERTFAPDPRHRARSRDRRAARRDDVGRDEEVEHVHGLKPRRS